MDVDEFTYVLPEEAIAQEPVEPRDSARLLVAVDPHGAVDHRRVRDLPALLREGDVLVVNETRVLPARLHLTKATGGAAEVLLLEQTDEMTWEALVRPGRRLQPGTVLYDADGEPAVEVGERLEGGRRTVCVLTDIATIGEVPLPPYITKPLDNPDRYQTVYATTPDSVAAPTAGLHLTESLLDEIRDQGVEVVTVDLAVGLDTFRPISTNRVEDHVMHTERYRVPEETAAACRRSERVVAVGTTTMRALESAFLTDELEGRTDLFITPGFDFRAVDVLMTNFHMPRSSLLVLLAAFAGDRWRSLYDTALAEGYRFLSFGDAMLVSRAG